MKDHVRVVVVDDHPLVVDGLRLALELAGMEVLATAGSVVEAVEAVRQHLPDVVVMDIQLPDGSGVERPGKCFGPPRRPPCSC